MSTATSTAEPAGAAAMGRFERYLTVWVALCILAGIALGQLFPTAFQAIGALEVAKVNIPVGLLIWVMIIPMLLKIDFSALGAESDAIEINIQRAEGGGNMCLP